MAKRIISAVIGFPLLAGIIVAGDRYLKVALIFLSLVGMYEVYMALSKTLRPVHYVGFTYCISYILLIGQESQRALYMMNSVFIIALMVSLVIWHMKMNIIDCAVAMIGFFYVAFLLSNIYLVREFSYQGKSFGEFFVWLIFICAWACDTGAYFVGVTIGKHKITPRLSPNKTVEGAIGGVVTAGLVAFIYGLAVSRMFSLDDINIILFCVIIGVAGSVFAQLGDLTASAIKRYTGIKDFGNVIPGHGGIIDRFDSVLFTAPVVYLVMRVLFTNVGIR